MKLLPAGRVDDYEHKTRVISSNIYKHDLIYAHIKGPDEFGHDGDAEGKKKNIEKIDTMFFAKILEISKLEDISIVISADHCTPCIKKSHSPDPVPLLISNARLKGNSDVRFTEEYAAKGILGRINGVQVIPTVMRTIGKL
jgi:2,3-bisphosphoglycerate-independent phosphoglycerate mutase